MSMTITLVPLAIAATMSLTSGSLSTLLALQGKPLGEVITDLTAVGEELGVVIHCQSEDLFTRMHRI